MLTLLYFLVFISFSVRAQSELIFVCDSATLEPISFATIAGDTSGFYSHIDGSFPCELLTEEEYRVTCIGYHQKTLKTNSVRDTFFLAPSQVQLGEAVVKGEYEAYEIGYHDLASFRFSYVGSNHILAVFIESSSSRNQVIEEIIIPFNHLRKGDEFTVFLFSANRDGTPDELIFEKDIKYEKRRNKFRLDVKNSDLILPEEGVFAGVSLHSKKEEKAVMRSPAVPLTKDLDDNVTFFFTNQGWFLFEGSKDQRRNLAIGLKVRPF